MTQAITFELLRSRTLALYERTIAEHGPVEQILPPHVVCDRCGLVVNLIADPFPIGWTTTGDDERGWTDLCRSCSQ